MINLPQSDFTWSESYVWRKPYTIPTGYTLEAIEVYATNGDATLSGVYRFIDGKMCICVTGTYLDSTKWTVKPISNSYNFICNLKLRKNNKHIIYNARFRSYLVYTHIHQHIHLRLQHVW